MSIISKKPTHVLTINDESQYVVAIAYRPDPDFDEEEEGSRIEPRIATESEIETGKSSDGKDVIVALARPIVAEAVFDCVSGYGYSGKYLGSSQLMNGPLGREWGWNAGMLLSNGEPPRENLSWDLEAIERDERGEIVNKISPKPAE